jgi:putative ABC transport system ATP-binding protein
MIQLANVKNFNLGRPNEFVACRGNLSIEANKLTVFKGPSGSGKTTLLSLIGCMARPTSGRIHLLDREITSLPERFLTEIRRKTFGFIFQQYNLIQGVTALENVMVPAYPSGEKSSALERAMDFDIFNISKADSCRFWRRNAASAIARPMNPQVVIADEPTAHSTPPVQGVQEIMGRLKESSRTVLIASHDPVVSNAAGGLRDPARRKVDGEAG